MILCERASKLVGATDGVPVLENETGTGNKAKLTIANSDTEGFKTAA